jgi:hypothetical protein
VSGTPPDRATIAALVIDDLHAIDVDPGDDAVGIARIVAVTDATVAGAAVVREIMSRVGVRTRELLPEGEGTTAGTAVLELGGSVAAIHCAAPLALTWLTHCSAVASGATPPEPGNPIDAYAARLSAAGTVGHHEPSFRLEIEREHEGIEG